MTWFAAASASSMAVIKRYFEAWTRSGSARYSSTVSAAYLSSSRRRACSLDRRARNLTASTTSRFAQDAQALAGTLSLEVEEVVIEHARRYLCGDPACRVAVDDPNPIGDDPAADGGGQLVEEGDLNAATFQGALEIGYESPEQISAVLRFQMRPRKNRDVNVADRRGIATSGRAEDVDRGQVVRVLERFSDTGKQLAPFYTHAHKMRDVPLPYKEAPVSALRVGGETVREAVGYSAVVGSRRLPPAIAPRIGSTGLTRLGPDRRHR